MDIGESHCRGRSGPAARWLALLMVLAALSACARHRTMDLPIVEPERHDVLAPYEAADWPEYLKRLDLPRERDYVIVSYLPTRHPFDLSSATAARRSLLTGLLDPSSEQASGSKIGHTIVAWQCGRFQGMTSMTGESNYESARMILDGFGLIPAFSTFTDGHLYPEGDHKFVHMKALREGRAVVTAAQVARAECENLRVALRRFVTHPNAPVKNFGLLEDPRRFEGGGCISFAFYLANAAGVMREAWPALHRDLPVYAGMLGAMGTVPDGVIPYRPPGGRVGTVPMALPTLLFSPWDRGPVVDRLSVADGELVLAAFVGLRRGLAPQDDWRFARVLPPSDPAIARAMREAQSWAARYPVRRIADPDGVQALVLERN